MNAEVRDAEHQRILRSLHRYPLVYLATPYSKYPAGLDKAFEAAAKIAAWLIERRVVVYSPIAHTHPIATCGKLDCLDPLWYTYNHNFMDVCEAVVVATIDGWQLSKGITYERGYFAARRKPCYYIAKTGAGYVLSLVP